MKAKNVAKRSSRVIDSESSSDDGDEIKIIFDEDSMDDVVMFQCMCCMPITSKRVRRIGLHAYSVLGGTIDELDIYILY